MQSVEKIAPDKKAAATASGFHFRTPADIQDFANQPAKQTMMNALWSNHLNGFTQQGMLNNPWNTINTPAPTNYYNPIDNNPTSSAANIQWLAFPGRLEFNFPSASPDQLYQMADTGVMPGQISNDPCGTGQNVPYFPYGPRGWQDEYCEWAVTRNDAGKITRIDFTCENPEYWNTLWSIDPNQVLALYQSILDKPQITLKDLSVPGVVDPITNLPVYNPLNKWNSGPVSSATEGGAIHLTSTPNTIQTEIGLATTSTVQRFNPPPPPATTNTMWPSAQYNNLICIGQFGQRYRNSDPNIGGTVNNFVTAGNVVTLADPPGLYIQMPDFSNYVTPDGTDASTFWTIKRGSKSLKDQSGNPLPGNFILHAVFEVPADFPYTVGDIKISGKPISWGSQVAYTFKMQIVASAYTGTTPQGYEPVDNTPPDKTFAQPVQLFYQDYFDTLYSIKVANPVNHPIPLLSNSTYIPAVINIGTTAAKMVVVVDTCTAQPNQPATYPAVTFDDPNITAQVTAVKNNISYAVPGNSQPSTYQALYITVAVGNKTAAGEHGVYVTNAGQSRSVAMPALLTVTPVTCQATIAWQNTGVIVNANTKTTVNYTSGLWTANPADNGGQLYNAAGNPTFFPAPPGYPLAGQNIGALLGRIGNTVFLIGLGTIVPANLSGELQLCINDDLNKQYGAGLTDNIGAVSVTIEVS
ncbi:hypothetical protein SAMN05444266_109339 [Chitinophaga jiangningensis]|uniref:Uncharacterized protein n=1 Tax=Chitinophaga jiangningensis TaxID=1419482 RepID=A0A1M7KI46_9BACT|nr:hypothetical protein [Chitinophaga jiangningensis]SHM64986.1 hypothetical protein SAMN05444266_109339 [Chitinophaga jiangningensis]